MNNWEHFYRELVEGEKRDVSSRLLLVFLRGCSAIYACAMKVRAAAYLWRILPVRRLKRPVISIGNITAGGTGKTPTVAWFARHLLAQGKRVAVLSRGYGGSLAGAVHVVSDGQTLYATAAEAGDEPVLLAQSIAGLIVVVGASRYQAGFLAQERFNPDVFLLDDGFQHMALHRDLNILLLDCARPFGTGRTFPAGFLREPRGAAARADLLLYTRCQADGTSPPVLPGSQPWSRARHHLPGFRAVAGGPLHQFCELKGERGLAFAGIASPSTFFAALDAAGVALVATLAFPDHICYGEQEIAALCRLMAASRSTYLITTEKDAVKLHPYLSRLGTVRVAPLELRILDTSVVEEMLANLFDQGGSNDAF